ncbi:MAG: hypothetical protein R2737_07585 [Candidatus Nanopelagicales bacterium]
MVRARRGRAALAGAAMACAALVLSGCAGGSALTTGLGDTTQPAESPTVLTSDLYAASVGADAQQQRVAELDALVRELRSATTSGWQVRQDDTYGYARDLSGGRFAGPGEPVDVAQGFLEAYGDVFGPDAAASVEFVAQPYAADGVAPLRLPQVYRGIPVDGGSLVVPVTRSGDGGEISLVRGTLLPVGDVDTTPTVTAAQAAATVTRAVGAVPAGPPELVVYAGPSEARLAWRAAVTVAGQADRQETGTGRNLGLDTGPAMVFVDAQTGAVLGSRPLGTDPALTATGSSGRTAAVRAATTPDLGKYDFTLPPRGRAVKVRGTLPDGRTVQVNAERLADGSLAMVDATGPKANRATKKGLIVLFDGSRLDGRTNAVGPVLRFPRGRQPSTDAVMAMWSARQVLDYYRTEFGRLSFDGRNSPLLVVLNFTQGDVCMDNAFFATVPGESRMMIGVPCPQPNGKPMVRTYADLYIVGHEVTHGVTHTNALDFAGANRVQQGAIDEGTSDYFGVLVQNRTLKQISTTGAHFACYELESEPFCAEMTNGQRGLRDINSGATFDDFAFTLVDPFGLATLIGDDGHVNSMVWTNALWKARVRLAGLDGGDLINSPRARAFDKAVNRATTLYLDSTSDLVDAAEAVQRAMTEVKGLGGTEQRLVLEQFQLSKLCRGCTVPAELGPYVAASSLVKTRPQVTGRGVVYTQFEGRLLSRTVLGVAGQPSSTALGPGDRMALRTGAHGDWVAETVVQIDARGNELDSAVLRNISTKESVTLSSSVDPTVGPAVSETAAVWSDWGPRGSSVRFRPLSLGTARTLDVGPPIAHLATDGTRVAIYLEDGTLALWDTATDRVRVLGQHGFARAGGIFVPSGGLAMSGDRIAVIDEPLGVGRVMVYDLAADKVTTLTEDASPFGIALDGDLVVWSEVTGLMPGLINQISKAGFVDTELRGYSFATGTYYEMADPRGQQGFPDLLDGTLAWQDTVGGSNDIYQMGIPDGS